MCTDCGYECKIPFSPTQQKKGRKKEATVGPRATQPDGQTNENDQFVNRLGDAEDLEER